MRKNLLKIIKDAKEITNVIIITHNIDFLFVQSMLVPALRKCSSPMLTIFADADCATQTYQYQAGLLNNLGSRYRVVPVPMNKGFRFHPKATFLSGTKSASLLVGSGNLTLGGWRENGEIWCRYDTDTDGIGVFADFRSYMEEIIALCRGSQDFISGEIREAFDPGTRAWAADMEPVGKLLGRAGQGASMLEQMGAVLGGKNPEHLYVCTPYFDSDAEAMQKIAGELATKSVSVLVQSRRTNLLEEAAAGLGSDFKIKATTFRQRLKNSEDGEEKTHEAFLHAKFYAAQLGKKVTVFAGSANCSRAALTIPGAAGNAELMTHFTVDKEDFEREFLNELIVEDTVPELAAAPEEQVDDGEDTGFIRILAAHMKAGQIKVTFQVDKDTEIAKVQVVDSFGGLTFHVADDYGSDWLTFKASPQARMIALIGYYGGAEIKSLLHWVDHEHVLCFSAKGRSMIESIHTVLREESWNIGSWTIVLAELYKNFHYTPNSTAALQGGKNRINDGKKPELEFEWDDVFSDSYKLSIGLSCKQNFLAGGRKRIGWLRSLLLRWLGDWQPEVDQPPEGGDEDFPADDTENRTDGEGVNVDKPVALPKEKTRSLPLSVTDNERKKALRLVDQVICRLVDPDFLNVRRPEILGMDFRIVSVLLRAGLAEGWLTEQEFFDASLKVWLPIFFNAADNENHGWLEQLYLTAPNQNEFAAAIRSVELAAALGSWALSAPERAGSPEHILFDLASILSVARLPWLWQTGGNDELAKEITEILASTARSENINWQQIGKRWTTLIRRGYALNLLEKAVSDVSATNLRSRIKQANIDAGELLWQRPYGFCVAKHSCNRKTKQNCEVLILQKRNSTKKFSGMFLIPVSGLLEDEVFDDKVLPSRARKTLLEMTKRFRVII